MPQARPIIVNGSLVLSPPQAQYISQIIAEAINENIKGGL